MAERIRVLLSEEEVNERIRQIGEQISKDYEGRQVHLICVLRVEVSLCVSLPRELQFPYLWISCLYPVMAAVQNPAV